MFRRAAGAVAQSGAEQLAARAGHNNALGMVAAAACMGGPRSAKYRPYSPLLGNDPSCV